MQPVLIGLHGVAESGKDTGFRFIKDWAESHNFSAVRDAFADRLKTSAAMALGWEETLDIGTDPIEFCNYLKQDGSVISVTIEPPLDALEIGTHYEISGREYLQFYGTEAHRDVFDYDFWVNAVLPLEGSADPDTLPDWCYNFYTDDDAVANLCVVTDVRFPNEAERVKELGGYVWKIDRDVPGAGDHASEQTLPPELIDLTIDNNQSLEDYAENLAVALEYTLQFTRGEGI